MSKELTVHDLSFETKTFALKYVLEKHTDSFLAFLLNGPRKELSREQMKKAIDAFFEIRFIEDKTPANEAQFEINDKTQEGLQNLTVIRWFVEFMT